MKIAILDDYQNVVQKLSCFQILSAESVKIFSDKFYSTEELVKALYDFDALVLTRERTEINSKVISLLPHLKVISQTGRPGEHIDAKACTEKGIAILAGSGSPIAPAELTWALLMSAQRRLPLYSQSLREGKWQSASYLQSDLGQMGRVLNGSTLGIFGLGKIGSLVAQYGKAFGMKILVYGQENSKKKALELGYQVAENQEQFFRESDILTVHLRSNTKTAEIIKKTDLLNMKPDAVFINTSRSQLVENEAISFCLKNNLGPHIFALDVFDNEPVTKELEWIRSPRVVATPHIGFVELNSFELYYKTAFQNLISFKNRDFKSVFNVEVLPQLEGK